MRDIKFRVWDNRKDSNTYGMNYDAHKSIDWFDYIDYPKYYTLQQYAGLKDKNNKEIYDGDIVKASYKNEDELENYNGAYLVYSFVGVFWINNYPIYRIRQCDIEIIGNIHENPELLK